MRSRFSAVILGGLIALAAASASRASVTYDLRASFAAFGLGIGDAHVVYVSPDYISADRIVPASAVASCEIPIFPPDCDGPVVFGFLPDGSGDALVLGAYRSPPSIILFYQFTPGAFAHPGVYDALEPLLPARLTVTGPGVPEPASWALMVVGFAGLGAALRRRGAARA